MKFAAALDASGMACGLDAESRVPAFRWRRTVCRAPPWQGSKTSEYTIPNVLVAYQGGETGIPVTYWRAAGCSQNTFFLESFIDELAHAAE